MQPLSNNNVALVLLFFAIAIGGARSDDSAPALRGGDRDAEATQCAEAAQKSIDGIFAGVSATQALLDALPNGASCTLIDISSPRAALAVAQQNEADAVAEELEASNAKIDCSDDPMYPTVELFREHRDNDRFGLHRCESLQTAIKRLDDAELDLATKRALAVQAQASLAAAQDEQTKRHNDCVCGVKATIDKEFETANSSSDESAMENLIKLEKEVLCGYHNRMNPDDQKACGSEELTDAEKARLTLVKPSLYTGKVCDESSWDAPPPAAALGLVGAGFCTDDAGTFLRNVARDFKTGAVTCPMRDMDCLRPVCSDACAEAQFTVTACAEGASDCTVGSSVGCAGITVEATDNVRCRLHYPPGVESVEPFALADGVQWSMVDHHSVGGPISGFMANPLTGGWRRFDAGETCDCYDSLECWGMAN